MIIIAVVEICLFITIAKQDVFFYATKINKIFSSIQIIDDFDKYLFAQDDLFYYILRADTGETLWVDSQYGQYDKYPCGSPCFVYMGEVNDLPLFFDCSNGEYILPNEKGSIDYSDKIDCVIKPIIVGGINIVNIVDSSNGAGVLDIRRETYDEIRCDYDEVTIELKVNLKKGEHIEELFYQIPNGKFKQNDVIDLAEWH